MKVYVDLDLCAGTGICVSSCPEVFELNEDGSSTVKLDEVPVELEAACMQAADNCPTGAISIEQ